MNILSGITHSSTGYFGNATINNRAYPVNAIPSSLAPQARVETSAQTLLKIHQLREAISAIRPGRLTHHDKRIPAESATANSTSELNFATIVNTRLQSVEEINTVPTSFQHNGPTWSGSTVTAPWSGLGSTAGAMVGGTYDGSNGQGTLTFKVVRAGTHGEDDLRIRVFAPDGSTIENINIGKNDPLNQVYELSNGISITLNDGDLVRNDFFEVDTAILSTSYTPGEPGWSGSTVTASIGGSYDGAQGSGDLTFRVVRGGVHGEDDLRLRVFAPDDSVVETINVGRKDALDEVYSLSNGLTFSLTAGELIKNESFVVSVDASAPGNYTTSPDWIHASSTATITGTYDGSNGSGTLTFKALDNGVLGQDDLRVRVYRLDGSTMETVNIDANNPIDRLYELSNGLSLTFSAGNMIKNETFSIAVDASTNYSTDPNPIDSTAEPVINGVYDGSLGADTLTFSVIEEGVHGMDDLAFEVRSSVGTLIDTLNISGSDPVDQTYRLSNGLVLSLGAGNLALNESFTLSVNHLVPTSVNPDLAFSGSGIDSPKLEDGFAITDGAFNINGNGIAVFADDSINRVLDRINAANIDVSATFDAGTETILLTRNTAGNDKDIVLSDDTSGFLVATKLADATAQMGGGDETTPLAELQIMAGVSSGSITINSIAVAFDVNNDSLADVLARIEDLVPDTVTDFEAASGRLSIHSTNLEDLLISSGGTGFFQALNISEGNFEAVDSRSIGSRTTGISYGARKETARAISNFARRFNGLFVDQYGETADTFLQQVRNDLKSEVQQIFDPKKQPSDSLTGISFDFESEAEVFRFSDSIKRSFTTGLKTIEGVTEFNRFFFDNTQNEEGLVDRVQAIVKDAENRLARELGSAGSFVDMWA